MAERAMSQHRGNAKLTEDLVREIIATYYVPNHPSQAQIAKRFDVAQPTVHQVVQRKTWSDVDCGDLARGDVLPSLGGFRAAVCEYQPNGKEIIIECHACATRTMCFDEEVRTWQCGSCHRILSTDDAASEIAASIVRPEVGLTSISAL
jgi:ribosomal protein S27E